MINVLPDEHKKQIRAGRVNALLLRYTFMMIGGIALLVLLLAGTYVTISVGRLTSQNRVEENERKEESYTAIRSKADSFRSDLSTAKTILDNEIRYSALLYRISTTLPKSVVLDNLNVDAKELGTQVTLNASSKSYKTAVKLKNSFENNKKLFSDVKLQSITYQRFDETKDPYKYKINIQVIINKEAIE